MLSSAIGQGISYRTGYVAGYGNVMLSAAGLAVQKELGSINNLRKQIRGEPVEPSFRRRSLRRAQGERMMSTYPTQGVIWS